MYLCTNSCTQTCKRTYVTQYLSGISKKLILFIIREEKKVIANCK